MSSYPNCLEFVTSRDRERPFGLSDKKSDTCDESRSHEHPLGFSDKKDHICDEPTSHEHPLGFSDKKDHGGTNFTSKNYDHPRGSSSKKSNVHICTNVTTKSHECPRGLSDKKCNMIYNVTATSHERPRGLSENKCNMILSESENHEGHPKLSDKKISKKRQHDMLSKSFVPTDRASRTNSTSCFAELDEIVGAMQVQLLQQYAIAKVGISCI